MNNYIISLSNSENINIKSEEDLMLIWEKNSIQNKKIMTVKDENTKDVYKIMVEKIVYIKEDNRKSNLPPLPPLKPRSGFEPRSWK